jgi:hypothetical protein
MLKKTIVALAIAAKALALAVVVGAGTGATEAADSDCFPCMPPPQCWPNCDDLS